MKRGALINVGSEVSDSPIPLQGIYSASKHAVKGFTDSLRMELEADGLPISVSIIKPTAINTPFPQNAKNHLPYEPDLPNPVYAPELVAEAILHCAENPVKEFFVGETAKLHSSMAKFMPGIGAKLNEMAIDTAQNKGEPAKPNRHDGLHQTNSNLRERGEPNRFTFEDSVYQRAKIHPLVTGALAIGAGVGIAALYNSFYGKSDDESAQTKKPIGELVVPVVTHEPVVTHKKIEVGAADDAQLKLSEPDEESIDFNQKAAGGI